MTSSIFIPIGYHYSFTEAALNNPDLLARLCDFPSNTEIDKILSIAKVRADALIYYAGMQEVPSCRTSAATPSDSDENSGLSTSVSKQYEIIYNHEHGSDAHEASLHTAASLTQVAHAADRLFEPIDDKAVEDTELVASRLATSCLINPTVGSDLHITQNSLVGLELCLDPMIALVEDKELISQMLLKIRKLHDSQTDRKKGNEQRKKLIQPGDLESLTSGNEISKMNPGECSKIVSVIVRGCEGLEKKIARLHRWNISVPLNLKQLQQKNPTKLDINSVNLYSAGRISAENPLELGRFAVIIIKSVSRTFRKQIVLKLKLFLCSIETLHRKNRCHICFQEQPSSMAF